MKSHFRLVFLFLTNSYYSCLLFLPFFYPCIWGDRERGRGRRTAHGNRIPRHENFRCLFSRYYITRLASRVGNMVCARDRPVSREKEEGREEGTEVAVFLLATRSLLIRDQER